MTTHPAHRRRAGADCPVPRISPGRTTTFCQEGQALTRSPGTCRRGQRCSDRRRSRPRRPRMIDPRRPLPVRRAGFSGRPRTALSVPRRPAALIARTRLVTRASRGFPRAGRRPHDATPRRSARMRGRSPSPYGATRLCRSRQPPNCRRGRPRSLVPEAHRRFVHDSAAGRPNLHS